jgi:hypothetical protein
MPPRVKVVVTDADYEQACRGMLVSWASIKASAVKFAAERQLRESSARQEALCRRLNELAGSSRPGDRAEFTRASAELDRLFAAHDDLLDAAYPRSAKAST